MHGPGEYRLRAAEHLSVWRDNARPVRLRHDSGTEDRQLERIDASMPTCPAISAPWAAPVRGRRIRWRRRSACPTAAITLSFLPDYELQTNDLIGQGTFFSPVSGAESVKEEYLELRVPLVEDKPFARSRSIWIWRHVIPTTTSTVPATAFPPIRSRSRWTTAPTGTSAFAAAIIAPRGRPICMNCSCRPP